MRPCSLGIEQASCEDSKMFKKLSSLHNERSFRGQNFADPLCYFHSSNICKRLQRHIYNIRKINEIILGGIFANMCVKSHLRELLEQGFEVAVVKDATAAPKHPEWGYGYTAALINYAFLAHAVLTTDEAVKAIERGQR